MRRRTRRALIDSPPAIDAKSFDLSCLGSADPTTTSAGTVTVGGTAETVSISGAGGASGVSLTLIEDGSDDLQTVTSGSDGSFTFTPVETNGSAVALTLQSTGSGDREDFVFPAAPLVADQTNVPVLEITDADLGELSLLTGSANTADGVFVLELADCSGAPIGGATIALAQGGSDVGSVVDIGQFEAALAGTYIGVSMSRRRPTTITATLEGHTFRTRTGAVGRQANTPRRAQARSGHWTGSRFSRRPASGTPRSSVG